ncbi:MAG: redoxin family protein [Thermoanaerobaculaceae bacterium]|jgi:thiol-disulfide isomerase/thioredoxin/DsbC/DsbD-like thiol-disulfide interchange protein
MRFATRVVLLLGAGLLIAATPPAFSATPTPVKVQATLSESAFAAGASAEIAVVVTLEPGWHIYSLTQPAGGPVPTTVKLDPCGTLVGAGPLRQGTFEKHREEAFSVDVESFAATAEFWVPVKVVPKAKPGTYTCAVRVRCQACDGKICLPPTDYVAEVKLVVAKKGAVKPAAKTAEVKPAEQPKEAAKPAPKSVGMDLRALYEAARLARPDRTAYGRLANLVPELLKDKTFDGEDAYYAGMLWVLYDSQAEKDDDTVEVTEVAKHLEAYLTSPDSHRNAESAEANLIAAYASLKRFDEAVTRYDDFSKHYRWGSRTHDVRTYYTNFEFASMELVRALTEAKRWPELEKVARLGLTYWQNRRSNDSGEIAETTSALLEALEAQKKTDELAKAREDVAKLFHDGDKMTALVDLIKTRQRVEELEKSDPPAALKVLETAKDLYAKAEWERDYDTSLRRLKLHGQPAPRLEGDAWVNSQPLTLAALRGKVIVLDFWMTWCGPCRASFPKMEVFAKKHADKGVVLIGVTENQGYVLNKEGKQLRGEKDAKLTWEEEIPLVKQFVKDFEITVPVAIGRVPTDTKEEYPEVAMLHDYGVPFYPSVAVIDRKGNVRFMGDAAEKALEELVTKLEAEPSS